MSVTAMAWAFKVKCPGPLAKLVLLKLADHANEDMECWPSQGRISESCCMPRETVNRQIKALSEAGLLRIEHRTNGTGKQANRYFLLCDATSQPDVTYDHTPCDATSHRTIIEPSKSSVPKGTAASAAPNDPVKQFWDRGVALLGGNRALLGKLVKEHDQVAVMEAIEATEAQGPPDPVAYLIGCLRRRAQGNGGVTPFGSPGFA